MPLELRSIGAADPAGPAALLAARHERHRAALPLLAEGDAAGELARLLDEDGCEGTVALRDGSAAGYLAGRVRTNAVWGTHAWVDLAGHASSDPELTRDLYAAIAPGWIEAGARLHLVLVPALPELMDPWYRLGFGLMQAHAIRAAGAAASAAPAGVTIRRGEAGDLERLAREHGSVLWRHQAGPPAFTGLEPPPQDEVLASWLETFQDPTDTLFLAEQDGVLIGHSLLYRPSAELGMPADAIKQATAVVLPAGRGRGIGRALVEHGFAWAKQAGHGSIVTDWRVANLEASRFWPARGFQVAHHRMYRMTGVG